VLDDLEAWHLKDGRRDAALEARLERYRRLHAAFTEADDRAFIREDLRARLPGLRSVEWWSMGMAQLAEFVRDTGDLVAARQLALEGERAYPRSLGGQRCLHLVKAIELPDFQLQAMRTDGPGERSIEVRHKNVTTLHLKAWTYDLEARLRSARDYNLLPQGDELQKLAAGKPAFEWTVELPATPDFKHHRTFVTPPMTRPGMYVIGASAKKQFDAPDNQSWAVHQLVSPLVLVSRQQADELEVTAVNGESGKPEADVEVVLYRYDWQTGHRPVATVRSDRTGVAKFRRSDERGDYYFLVGRKGGHLALDLNHRYFYRAHEEGQRNGAFIYTDRSIYRPQQKAAWKIVAYQGRDETSSFKIVADASITVSLHDGNGQVVSSQTVKTNRYGTASGEFTLPAGRVLGQWSLHSSWPGHASFRVEEYKRPTFEVSLEDPTEPLRLNRPANLVGAAKYYFGLPVTNGKIRWRVLREPVYPWWWHWWGWGGGERAQTIATGEADLQPDGRFKFTFRPEADERKKAQQGLSYRFSVSADLTDEGGETRSATRAFRLGFVSVEATVTSAANFLLADRASKLSVARTTLDGVGRAGKGSWRLFALRGPKSTPTPAELGQLRPPAEDAAFRTPRDALRARWDTAFNPELVASTWADGEQRAAGELTHDGKGEATLELPPLAPGAYRVRYETQDDFGAKAETWKVLFVAGNQMQLPLPAVLLAEHSSVPVGGTARFLVHSGLADQPLQLDLYRDGKLIERRRLTSGQGSLVELPVKEAHRGGFGVVLSGVRDYAFMSFVQSVFVPWDDRQLKLEFATFRDKLRPGAKETFRVTVRGHKDELVQKGAAELLAYMYDRSLDVFAPHHPPSPLALYRTRTGTGQVQTNLGAGHAQSLYYNHFHPPPAPPHLHSHSLAFYDAYGVGGMGRRNGMHVMRKSMRGDMAAGAPAPPAPAAAALQAAEADGAPVERKRMAKEDSAREEPAAPADENA
ncbi:MAG: MG2 domain-containing protein, partial [Myxococcales bacterium]